MRHFASWLVKSVRSTKTHAKSRSLSVEILESREVLTVAPPPVTLDPLLANPDHLVFNAVQPIQISGADLLANDLTPPMVETAIEILTNPTNGQFNLIQPDLWEYVPGAGFSGSDTFSYRLFDGTNYSSPALVTIEQLAPSSTSPTIKDQTESWLTGFENEPLSNVTVAQFEVEGLQTNALDWSALVDWADGTTTPATIIADSDGGYRVLGDHTYNEWGVFLVKVHLTTPTGDTFALSNLAHIEFRNFTHTYTDPAGNTTQFVFSEGWQLIQEIDPLGHSSFFTYTSDGLLASRTDRLGRVTTFTYGPDNVLQSQTWLAADGVTFIDTLSFTYTTDGRMTSASNAHGAYSFHWNNDQLVSVTNPFGVTLSFGYDIGSNRTSVADSFGGLVTSVYDAGLLSSRTLQASGLNIRVELGYDADGGLTQIDRLSGELQTLLSQTEYEFAQGLLASITHRNAGGAVLDQFLYQSNQNGLLGQIDSGFGGTTSYGYDAKGQLVSESSLLVTSTFEYDANGNRVGGAYLAGPGNRMVTDGIWGYSYDHEGNLINKIHQVTGVSWAYTYDHRNQMILAEKSDSSGVLVLSVAATYDAFGNRIEKSVDPDGVGPLAAVVTRYVLDGWNNRKPIPVGNEHFDIYAELDGNNQLIRRSLHGDEFDQTFAQILVGGTSSEVHWLLTDHLNSVRLVHDENGALLDQIAYDAFGNIVAQLNPLLDNPILFASRDFDAETGLYYNRARYLDPAMGRWTTQDPLGLEAGDANLYRYVGNTVTMATDPSGNIWYPGKYLYQMYSEYYRGRDLDRQLVATFAARPPAARLLGGPGPVPTTLPGRWEMTICVGPQAGNWNVTHSWIELRGASPENAGQFYTITRCNIICVGADVNGDFQSTSWSRNSRIVENPRLPGFTPSWTCGGYTAYVWAINTGNYHYFGPIVAGPLTFGLTEQIFTPLVNFVSMAL